MTGLIKEEFFTTIKKKRFIILTVILFICAVVKAFITKNNYLNDLTYLSAVQDYIWSFFSPFMGLILIFSLYRKQYTRSSILQVQDRGLKRSSGVIARAAAGSLVLICCYALMALFLMLLGVIFGAHLTAQQNGIIFLMVATDCLAAIASLMGALFVLYLCPLLSIPALLVYSILMYFGPDILIDVPGSSFHKIGCIFLPKLAMDSFCTGLVMSYVKWAYVLILVLQFLVPFLLTLLVFKLKKLKEPKEKKPRKKKDGEPDAGSSDDDEAAAVIAATTVI